METERLVPRRPSAAQIMSSLEKERDPREVAEIVAGNYPQEVYLYYKELAKDRHLEYKLDPIHPDREILLPASLSPSEYCQEYERRAATDMAVRKRAVDRLIEMNVDMALGIVERNRDCGYVIDAYLREQLALKGGRFREVVSRDLERFAIRGLRLPEDRLKRFFRELLLRRGIRKGRVHHNVRDAYRYYCRVRHAIRQD